MTNISNNIHVGARTFSKHRCSLSENIRYSLNKVAGIFYLALCSLIPKMSKHPEHHGTGKYHDPEGTVMDWIFDGLWCVYKHEHYAVRHEPRNKFAADAKRR